MAKAKSYQELKAELDGIMLELQNDQLDVDAALKYYERGLQLVVQLEDYLKKAENRVRQLKSKPGA